VPQKILDVARQTSLAHPPTNLFGLLIERTCPTLSLYLSHPISIKSLLPTQRTHPQQSIPVLHFEIHVFVPERGVHHSSSILRGILCRVRRLIRLVALLQFSGLRLIGKSYKARTPLPSSTMPTMLSDPFTQLPLPPIRSR